MTATTSTPTAAVLDKGLSVRLSRLLAKYFGTEQIWRNETDPLRVGVRLVDALRKGFRSKGGVRVPSLEPLLALLREEPRYREGLKAYIDTLVTGKPFRAALTDPGILADAQFMREVVRRISYKVLPYQPIVGTLPHVLMQLFYKRADAEWVRNLPASELIELFDLLGFGAVQADTTINGPMAELLASVEVLAHRMCGRALEEEVLKMMPEDGRIGNPFIAFQREYDRFSSDHFDRSLPFDPNGPITRAEHARLMELLDACSAYVERAFANSERFGISISVNQSLLRIRQQVQRIRHILELIVVTEERSAVANTVELARSLIIYNGEKTDLRQLVDQSTRLVAYEITQHTGKTGEHYITDGRKGYNRMFLSAGGGGLIVGVMCIIKVQLGHVDAPLFFKALISSANYAIGFTLIYLTGATLATKQPAMTAATLVKNLKDAVSGGSDYAPFARLFARVFRSQFIAFVGNVLFAFPMALLIAFGVFKVFHYMVGADKWHTLINDLSPVTSLSIFHAAIAGCFLFLSGIIAGSVANRGRHERIPLRIAEHPWLKRTIGPRRSAALARFYEKKWAGILSNIVFGLCMGSTYYIGQLFGLPLDIRHITFAAGNFAIGIHAAGWSLPFWMIFWSILGIFLIGLVNFAVSFALSLSLAMRSRSIPFRELPAIAKAVYAHFREEPMSFFLPRNAKSGTAA